MHRCIQIFKFLIFNINAIKEVSQIGGRGVNNSGLLISKVSVRKNFNVIADFSYGHEDNLISVEARGNSVGPPLYLFMSFVLICSENEKGDAAESVAGCVNNEWIIQAHDDHARDRSQEGKVDHKLENI